MNVFIVATPLFDCNMEVTAYRLHDQSEHSMFGLASDFRRMSEALTSPGLDLVQEIGLEPFTAGKPMFAEINRFQLFTGMPHTLGFEPECIVSVLPEEVSQDPDVLTKCNEMRQLGYRFALSSYPTGGAKNPILQYVDYLMICYKDDRFYNWYQSARKSMWKQNIIITDVPDMDAYNMLCSSDHNSLYDGFFYSQPITRDHAELSPIKTNLLRLINQVNQDDFDLLDVVEIIERDPYLTISLLRFINSAAVGISQNVTSIRQAVAILGQKEVRRWATVALSVTLAEDRPSELTKLSLTRAKFAENLAGVFELGMLAPSLFMAGLFSLLDVVLEKPMDDALDEIAVDDRIREALVDQQGRLYQVLEFIYAYERADWDKVQIAMIRNSIEIMDVTQAFIDALVWYNQLLTSLDDESEEQEDKTPDRQKEKPTPTK